MDSLMYPAKKSAICASCSDSAAMTVISPCVITHAAARCSVLISYLTRSRTNWKPFVWDAFYEYEGRIRVGVTNAHTGEIEYMDGRELDEKCTMLRATCAIPLYFPAIKIDGKEYFDGGLADSIPIRKALHDGSKKNLIILTQPEGYRKHTGKSVKIANMLLRRRFPKLCDVMLNRAKVYNDTVCFCEQLAKKRPHDAVLLRPAYAIDSFEKSIPKLEDAYRHGYNLAMSRMDEIRALFD